MDIHNEFLAQKKELVFYAGKAILNREHTWYDLNDELWDFSDAIGFSFKIWQERDEDDGLLKIDWGAANLTPTGNGFILNSNASDTALIKGKYYYEIEYQVAGGYSVLIGYGLARFI